MGQAEEVEDIDSLVFAPTWAVASVCSVFILCSLIVERIFCKIGKWWTSRKQVALLKALEKIKEELMMVGFISLAIAFGSTYVSKLCVPKEWTNFMRQCKRPKQLEEPRHFVTIFAQTSPTEQICSAKGKAQFITLESLHHLHIFIFALAVVHVVYSILIIVLGTWRVRRWRHWEEMSSEMDTASAHAGLRYTKDATFIKRHVDGVWSKHGGLSYIAAFFQQFNPWSVISTDYLTLRHGFISKHGLQKDHDFHKDIMRSLEREFKHVIGISPGLWGYMVVLMLVNVEGWGMLYWAPWIPFIMVLIVGTKLRRIITKMAILCLDKNAVIEGVPVVTPSDDLFWFRKPRLILSLIHFILFQNALELALDIWSTLTFPKSNCFNRHGYFLVVPLILGPMSQALCGLVVLPIYAIVSQMGSKMKEHDDMEMAILRLHDDKSENPTRVAVQNEVPITSDSPHKADSVIGRMEGEGDEDSITEFDDSQGGGVHLQRRMSYLERKARGVQGEDYYKLEPPSTQRGHASV